MCTSMNSQHRIYIDNNSTKTHTDIPRKISYKFRFRNNKVTACSGEFYDKNKLKLSSDCKKLNSQPY